MPDHLKFNGLAGNLGRREERTGRGAQVSHGVELSGEDESRSQMKWMTLRSTSRPLLLERPDCRKPRMQGDKRLLLPNDLA